MKDERQPLLPHNLDDRWQEIIHRDLPWGAVFATRSNFEWGYFIDEGQLVAKYLRSPSDVLVIGSGNGREARPICRDGHWIVCMDIGQTYLKSGQKLFANSGIQNVLFLQANMAQLPFKEYSFDFIFFSLYGVGKKRFDVLAGIRRVLRLNGLILLTVGTPLYKVKYDLVTEVYIANEAQLREEVSPCGFEVLESSVDPERPEYRVSILRKQS